MKFETVIKTEGADFVNVPYFGRGDHFYKNSRIIISIRKKGDKHLIIRVEDNGKGMDEELVKELNNYDYLSGTIEGSIGVRNVIMRIKYYYGEEGYIFIESNEKGTKITAEILFEE